MRSVSARGGLGLRIHGLLLFACACLALSPRAPSGLSAAEAAAAQPGVGLRPTGGDGIAAALDDLWLEATVKARLLRSSEVSGFDLDVDARRGVVTLFGMVDSVAAQAAAELAAAKLDRVQRVANWIEVVPAAEQPTVRERDRTLAERVRARLTASPGLPRLDVTVCNGVVRLRGRVASASEHRAALAAVTATTGVRHVMDQLAVEAGSQAL